MTEPPVSAGVDDGAPATAPAPAPTFADQLAERDRDARAERSAGAPYRSAATRAKVLIALLWVSLAASLVAVATNVWGLLTTDAFLADRATLADLEAFDAGFATVGLAETAIFLITAVAWLAWQSRTVDNEAPLAIGPSPWSPAMSIVWWFVPLANLVQPYRIHADIHRRYVATQGTGLVLVWWLVWMASNLVTNAAGRYWLIAETFDQLQIGLYIWLVGDILGAVSAVPALILVRRIQACAEVLSTGAGTAAGEPPPPAVEPTVA